MDERVVSRLITGKARKYLRTSMVVLSLSLLVLSTFLVFTESQQQQVEKDFRSNDNVHVIELRADSVDGSLGRLAFGDMGRLAVALDERFGRDAYTLTSRYELGFGIPDTDGTDRFFYGIDGDTSRLLGLARADVGTAYVMDAAPASALHLRVPVIDVATGGMSSGSHDSLTLALAGGVSPSSPLMVLGPSDAQAVYVDGLTFQSLVTTAFSVDWPTFVERHDADNPFGLDVVRSIYVHVDDLEDVRPVADLATKLGFSANFTLKAFDDLSSSLRTANRIGLLTVVAVLLACMAYVFLNFNSYIALAHRDLGILKHLGFSSRRTRRLFSRRVASVCCRAGILASVHSLILGTMMLRGDTVVRFTAMSATVVAACIGAIYLFTTQMVFRHHTDQDVLTLLNLNREFE